MKFIRSRIKKQIDEDNEKRNEIVEKRKIAWQIWWKKHSWNQYTKQDTKRKAQKNTLETNESKWKQMETMEAVNVNDNVNVNVNVNDNVNYKIKNNNLKDLNKISNEILIDPKNEIKEIEEKKEYWNSLINELINELKKVCNEIWVAYDKNSERNFAHHIMTAKEFGEFCKKVWQSRIEFAKNVLKASVQIWYWKGACSWPKKIYQNYADVFNEAVRLKQKEVKNTIKAF